MVSHKVGVYFRSLGYFCLVGYAFMSLLVWFRAYFHESKSVWFGIDFFGEADFELFLLFLTSFFICYHIVTTMLVVGKGKVVKSQRASLVKSFGNFCFTAGYFCLIGYAVLFFVTFISSYYTLEKGMLISVNFYGEADFELVVVLVTSVLMGYNFFRAFKDLFD